MKFEILFFTILTLIAAANAVAKSYNGYKVYKVIPKTENEAAVLKDVQQIGLGEFWEDHIAVKYPSRIMVSKENQGVFLARIKAAQMVASETTSDLQKTIEDQIRPAGNRAIFQSENLFNMTWDRYYSLTEISNWLDVLATNYPDIVSTVVWGQSNENRELKGIVLDYHPERENKLIAVIEGALHAREWITPATVTGIIKDFLISNDPEIRALARNFEWHILPVANPDGYEYTFTNHRMWRKNRNTIYNTTCAAGNDMSNGVDLNRNFGFSWMTIGATLDPCSNTFAGSAGFSEPETRVIADYVRSLQSRGEMIYYLAFHSYTQLVVIPYSHITSPNDVLLANNYANMYEIGARAAAKLEQRFGTHYRVGVANEVLYPMSGSSFDWVKNETDVPVSYLIELRDLGEYGFLLPPEQIIPNNLEIMDFLVEMDRQTRFLGYYVGDDRGAASSIVYSLTVVLFGVVFALF